MLIENVWELQLNYLSSLVVGALAIYGAMHLLNFYQLWSTHRKIIAWGQDPSKVQRLTSNRDLQDWLSDQHEQTLTDDVRLAISATVAACLSPVDSLHNDSGRNRVQRLGQMLRGNWGYAIERELERRKGVQVEPRT